MSSLVRILVPKELRGDPNLARRAALVAGGGALAGPVCWLFAAQQELSFASPVGTFTLLVAGLALVAMPALLFVVKSTPTVAHVEAAILCIAVGATSYARGGMIANVMMWTLVVPPASILFGERGYRSGVIWAAAILAEVVLLRILMLAGHPGTAPQPGTGVLGLCALVLITTGIAIGYEIRRRRLESERRELERQMLEHVKLESLGRLAAGVAHDFNNLLTIVKTHARLVADATGTASRSDLAAIEAAAERGAVLTRQLLAFGRKSVARPEALELRVVIGSVLGLLGRVLPENIEIDARDVGPRHVVFADRALIEHVIINLILNARDAMPLGGQLRVATESVEVGAPPRAGDPNVAPGRYVALVVADQGTGMRTETKEHLFEPFFTTKSETGGTGLGLSGAYGIARQAGGDVTCDSVDGEGTTFRVFLPLSEQTRAAGLDAGETDAPATSSNATILLVEDEPAVRRATERLLRGRGYKVLSAEDGTRALDVGKEHSGPIDLLLTDVVIPGLSGPELARALRNTRPDVRVTYMSGYVNDPDTMRQVNDGSASLVAKPYEPEELFRTIEATLRSGRSAPHVVTVPA